ncbi:MAG: hypothetical protein HRU15_16390 [Planctomycetes bacterium]|nr:hypothetical protein [Planctomycetota bacterium]
MHGDSVNSHNDFESPEIGVTIKDEKLSAFKSGSTVSVPAGSMRVISWSE